MKKGHGVVQISCDKILQGCYVSEWMFYGLEVVQLKSLGAK